MSTRAKWETPQLVVLARGTPEESVLLHCKAIGVGGGPTTISQEGCNDNTVTNCGACQSRSGS